LPKLEREDRPVALYHGLAAVARDSAGTPPRFVVQPLPGSTADPAALKRWFRRCVEVRDAEGAERCLVSAVRGGASDRQLADMLFAAATDHRYIDGGHVLDFTNKAFEALDVAGWDLAERTLASLATAYATADRMEESNAWRHPVDLVAILERAFEQLPDALARGHSSRSSWGDGATLVPVLLGDDPGASAEALLESLRGGARPEVLAGVVAYAAALRIARFPVTNEFSDWDTALHTLTFASAVRQALGRTDGVEALRGVFDAAMSVYLDRYLNVPPAALPDAGRQSGELQAMLKELARLLDRRQQVDESGALVSRYLEARGDPDSLLAALGSALLREDRDFHTIQVLEAGFRQYSVWAGSDWGRHVLIGVTRYLAAHAPTLRAQQQTFHIARRLSRGERLDEEV
jgi:hypothetical protein